MSAFNPIAPRRAAELIEQAGIGNPANILVGSSSIGLVKAYARMIETKNADGTHSGVRDSRIPRDLWQRIADAEMGEQILSSFTVLLAAEPANPAVAISGIRFDDKSLLALIGQHSAAARHSNEMISPNVAERAQQVTEVAAKEAKVPDAAASSPKARPALSALPEGAVLVTVNQAMAALGLGRTKVNDLMVKGTLVRVKIDTRTLITSESIRALIPPTSI